MRKTTTRITTVIMAILCIAMMTASAMAADVSSFNVPGLSITAESPGNTRVGEWTVTENGASVTGKGLLSFTRSSGTLTLSATEDGTVSFDYAMDSNAELFINDVSYVGSGSFTGDVSATQPITISAKFSGSSNGTVTISNIALSAAREYLTVNSSDYETVSDAVAAVSGDNVVGTVIVDASATVTSDLVIPQNVTLVVPCSAEDTGSTTGNNASGNVVNGSAYVTLTVSDGATLTVNGTMIVSGNQQATARTSGCLTGNFGKVALTGDMVVNGTLYARGEISGSGTATINDKATVYQMFQIQDWRGGNASQGAYLNAVFPFNMYEFKNITAKTIYMKGATMKGQYYIYAASRDNFGEVTIIGSDGEIRFASTADADDNIVLEYNGSVVTVTMNGDVMTGSIVVSLNFLGIDMDISSSSCVCPFGYNMNVVITEGATMEVTSDMKFLPGCDITVANGGTLTVTSGETLYFYGENGYSTTYNWAKWGPATAATLTVEEGGTVNSYGTIASTDAAFGNVDGFTSTGNTVTVKEVTQADTKVTVVPVTFYVGTNAASAAEEEAVVEEAVEEIVEEPVEEIIEIEEIVEEPVEEIVEVEETVIAE